VRIAVLASGRGSNLGALIDAQRGGNLPVHIVGVFSDKPSAPALALARESNIPTAHLDPRDFAQRLAFDLAAFATIAKWKPELIVLAGFMRILDPRAFEPWLGRIINIHPSLLPKYPGLHTHRRVLAAVRTAFEDAGFDPDEADLRANATFAVGIGFLHLSGRVPDPGQAAQSERFLDLMLAR